MKKIILFIPLFILFLITCKEIDKAKYSFIDQIVRNPDKMKAIIDTSQYNNKFAKSWFKIMSEYILKNKFTDGWNINYDEIINVHGNQDTIYIRHHIGITSKFNGEILEFSFNKELEKWKLIGISSYDLIH
jgi:hypothetical protein